MSACPHGHDHAALKRNPIAWAQLRLVGYQHTPADDFGPEEVLEHRDCSCRGTLSIRVRPTPELVALIKLGLEPADVKVMTIELREALVGRLDDLLASFGASDDLLLARAA